MNNFNGFQVSEQTFSFDLNTIFPFSNFKNRNDQINRNSYSNRRQVDIFNSMSNFRQIYIDFLKWQCNIYFKNKYKQIIKTLLKMNQLERLLHQQGKKVKLQEQELDDVNRRHQELQTKLTQEEDKNKILQGNIDKLSLIEYELRRQLQFVEAQRDNLLEQLKSLHEYNFSMFNLQENHVCNKFRTVQELALTRNELQKQQQQLLILQTENAGLISKVKELMSTNTSLNEKLQKYPQQFENLREKYIKLLTERDLQIQSLSEIIERLKIQRQVKEEKCEKIEFEESDLTEDTNSNQDAILEQQTFKDNLEIIKIMKKSDEEKQRAILQLTEQVSQLQAENSKQRLLLTTEQVIQLYPQDIQLQIRRLQQLRAYISQFTTKIANLQMKYQEINELKKRNLELEERCKIQQEEINQFANKKKKLEEIQEQFAIVLKENWKLKGRNQQKQHKMKQLLPNILQNLSTELCFEEYPFESLEELLKCYEKLRNQLRSQSEQRHKSQL
ncbi:unnamed protein product (macronuclear) [Paramecium tetraurelia]|uniref:Uncharacterized protein n=1 Tax=Paramecium tetraurelia TaxID=5888 RepID=A0DKJ0_PARTE|nr:uncharacterized protein GSPATT00017887001 [Paramecium tetraurelia]CAK83557.1 unnamed protein product [Paramecium tetraurelia]|eukprot:XP_001450954.1 hypothetical protein (macronuclear) [Paramecium tetraurelia strain d4-2]